MYAEVLAFLVGQKRPNAEVSLLGSSEELEEAALRVRPHLLVANRVPKTTKGGEDFFFYWVEVAEARAGDGAKRLDARISADGYSQSVEDVRTEHVLLALDRAERDFLPEAQDRLRRGHARGEGRKSS